MSDLTVPEDGGLVTQIVVVIRQTVRLATGQAQSAMYASLIADACRPDCTVGVSIAANLGGHVVTATTLLYGDIPPGEATWHDIRSMCDAKAVEIARLAWPPGLQLTVMVNPLAAQLTTGLPVLMET